MLPSRTLRLHHELPARLHARGGVLLLDPQNNNDHLIIICIIIVI